MNKEKIRKKLYKKQNGKCPICEQRFLLKDLSLDYDDCDNPKGLLCEGCGNLLIHASDNIQLLQNAIDYLDPTRKMR